MIKQTREFLELIEQKIKQTIEHEMRGVALTLPREDVLPVAPHNSDAEQVVLSALLLGHAQAEDVNLLEPRHFYSPFNGRLFQLLGETTERDLQALTDLLYALGCGGPVLEELITIRDATVFVCRQLLGVEVAKIVERWRQRELIRTMQLVDAKLRVGAITHNEARAELRQHFTDAAEPSA